MKAVLLIGGLATRLLPLSSQLPKSLLPVCDREILHYQITQLAMAGINEIVLAAGHQVEKLRNFVQDYAGGLRFEFSLEPEPRGTAGAIAQAREMLGNEPVVVLNADILSSVKIADVIQLHQRHGTPATLVGFAVNDPSRYGLLKAKDNELLGFSEKPDGDPGPGPHYINAGIYVLEPLVYEEIPLGQAVSIERQTFPKLLNDYEKLTHYPHEGLWLDIGTFESYFQANFTLLARRYAVGDDWLWGERLDCAVFKDLIYLHKQAQLDRGVDLFHRVIVMRGATIGRDCRLQNCLVLPDADIGSCCQLTDCIIGPGARVAAGTPVSNAVVIAGEPDTPFYPAAISVTQ